MRKGLFVTLEGVDGSGKSTQLRLLVHHLRDHGYRVCPTREPGGTALGDQIRRILVSSGPALPRRTGQALSGTAISPVAELVLVYAARAQHVTEVIRPALARGEIVVSDRFNDASVAYQGYGRGLGDNVVRAIDRIVCGSTQPKMTIVLDLPPQLALARALGREIRRKATPSRFEQEGLSFQQKVRAGYLQIAKRAPHRVKVVQANRPAEEIHSEIRSLVDRLLARRG